MRRIIEGILSAVNLCYYVKDTTQNHETLKAADKALLKLWEASEDLVELRENMRRLENG